MRLVVYHLSRKRFTSDIAGGTATVNFLKNGNVVHSEKITGKTTTRYVRVLPKIEFDCHILDCDSATTFIYDVIGDDVVLPALYRA